MIILKRATSLVLILTLALGLCPAVNAANVEPFEDVPADAYYAPAVEWAVESGVTNGMTPTRFGPEETVTRGQAVTFLWRAMGEPDPMSTICPFADVKATDYYYAPVLWAVEEGITNGTGPDTFSPGNTLTRAHIVTFLWRTAGWPEDTGDELWYADAVNWAQGADLLSGTARAFAPGDPCPRADVVTYLYRAWETDVLWGDWDEDFFDVPVEEMNDAQMLDALDEWIDADEDGMLDEDGFITLADWPELMEYMVDSAELLKEEGLIKTFSYSEEDAYILYTLRSGLRVCYEPPILEYKDCAGGYVSSIEPMYSSGEQFNFTNTAGDSIERITGLGIGYVSGGQLKNSAATIENIKAVFEKSENGIIIWLGHGLKEEPALRVGESYDESKHKALRDKGEIIVYPNGHMFLTSQWFQNELKSDCLHGSMVILGACCSLKDTSISDALKNKGAGAVIGSKKSIGVLKLCDTTEQLIYALAMQDKDGNYLTADEAMKKLVWRAYYGVDIFEGKLEIAFGGDWRLHNAVSGSVTGTVTDGKTGEPIAGAKVTCGAKERETDSNGRFTIDRLDTAKEYIAAVTADGYQKTILTVRPGDPAANVTISLVPDAPVSRYDLVVTVNDFAQCSGIPNAKVTVTLQESGQIYRATTGSDGTAGFNLPLTGKDHPYRIAVSADGYEEQDENVDTQYYFYEEPREITLQLKQYKAFRGEIVQRGACGDHVLWTLDSEGTLFIYGTGKMYNYKESSYWVNPYPVPWREWRDDVKLGWVESGVTHLGACTFDRCYNMTEIHLPSTIQTLGDLAVHCCNSLERVWVPDGVPTIPDTCFEFCNNLREIYIPASVTKVEQFAFLSDSNLTTVYYGGSAADWKKIDISTVEDSNEYLLKANIIYNAAGLPE